MSPHVGLPRARVYLAEWCSGLANLEIIEWKRLILKIHKTDSRQKPSYEMTACHPEMTGGNRRPRD